MRPIRDDLDNLVATIPFFASRHSPTVPYMSVPLSPAAVHDALVSVGGNTRRTSRRRHPFAPTQSIADTIV
jgi:hypothetical protein